MLQMVGVAVLVAVSLGGRALPATTATWTGWFSDKQCARVKPGEAPRPNGTSCVKKCLAEGAPAVFISEQAKAVYGVNNYTSAANDVGFYVEITGEVNERDKTVSIKSVKRLAEVPAICLPRKAIKQLAE